MSTELRGELTQWSRKKVHPTPSVEIIMYSILKKYTDVQQLQIPKENMACIQVIVRFKATNLMLD